MSRQRVFVVGAPRSGTTILLDILSAQPEFGYINQKLAAAPDRLELAGANRQYDWPLLGDFWFERRYWKKKLPAPAEGTEFWDHYLPGFKHDDGIPKLYAAEELTEKQIQACRDAVEEVHDRQHRDLFLGQYAGPARVRMLRAVFPEAKFVQLQRDPRSVAIRLSNRLKEEHGKAFWEARAGWKALMPEALRQRLDDLPDTPLNFAGVMVRWWQMQYREELGELPPEDFLSIAYADLLAKPSRTVERTVKYLGLDPAKRLKRYVKYHELQEGNVRMNKDLPDDAAAQLERAIKKVE